MTGRNAADDCPLATGLSREISLRDGLDDALLAEHFSTREIGQIRAAARYCRDFLGRGHPHLGRAGAICPYINLAVAGDHIRIVTYRAADTSLPALIMALAALRDVLHGRGTGQMLAALIILFPQLDEGAGERVEQVQRALKTRYVEAGLMIGEFHPSCPTGGLHNPEFRPFQAPVPMISIRAMTPRDAVFLTGKAEWRASFAARFGEAGHEA